MKLVDPKGLALSLIKEAVVLRTQREYERALANLEQAVESNPKLPDAHRELGRTLSYFASETGGEDPKQKKVLLDRAEAAIQRAIQELGKPNAECLHDLAWIYDERGDFEKAVTHYREAQAANRKEGTIDEAALAYNLACALAKAGRGGDAVEVLRPVIKQTWKWADTDPDFNSLRESQEFTDLIRSGPTSA